MVEATSLDGGFYSGIKKFDNKQIQFNKHLFV